MNNLSKDEILELSARLCELISENIIPEGQILKYGHEPAIQHLESKLAHLELLLKSIKEEAGETDIPLYYQVCL